MKLALAIAIIAILGMAHAQDQPKYPLWPNQFTVDFTEKLSYPLSPDFHTEGTLFYDYEANQYKISRKNGRGDRYCFLNGKYFFLNTPCDHIVDNKGDRYLYYPEKNDCCFCCAAKDGCGLTKPSWVEGAKYDGQGIYKGFEVFKWNQRGGQDNLYYETVESNPLDRKLVLIDQQPNDAQYFKPETFKKSVQSSELVMPSICKKEKTCSLVSVCNAISKGLAAPPSM